MFCRLCGKEVQDGEDFCPSCLAEKEEGKELGTKFCHHCGEKVKGIERFCLSCGVCLQGKETVTSKNVLITPQKPKEPPKTKRCKSCFAEIPTGAFYCPKCSKIADEKPTPISSSSVQGKSKLKGVLLGLFFNLFGLFLAWCFGDEEMCGYAFIAVLINTAIAVVVTFLVVYTGCGAV